MIVSILVVLERLREVNDKIPPAFTRGVSILVVLERLREA